MQEIQGGGKAMIRFKRSDASFETISVLQDFEPLGLIARIPENVIEILGLRPGDRLTWIDFSRGIIRLRLKRA